MSEYVRIVSCSLFQQINMKATSCHADFFCLELTNLRRRPALQHSRLKFVVFVLNLINWPTVQLTKFEHINMLTSLYAIVFSLNLGSMFVLSLGLETSTTEQDGCVNFQLRKFTVFRNIFFFNPITPGLFEQR